ncbi:MAG: DUF4845 domain-containing protein [Sulfuriferula sp.]|nr:DUF4845 domain-containing protein [Sulfuriferula sp.]
MINKQRGMGLFGIFFVAMGLVFSSIVVMKVVPAYLEYGAIKKVFKVIANDPAMKDAKAGAIRESYTRRSSIDNITSVTADDLDISHDDNGKLLISASYHVEKPLFSNVGIYIDFKPTSAEAP